MGGATEGSIWSNLFEVSLPLPDGWKSIPYGYPLRNQKYRIADAKGRDCPNLVPGELWIGGTGVALGYVNAPEITAAHFVEFEGERWYRTGDQGRYHKGGIMEFLGRLDHQVKVRGHRIELGEIESALCSVSGVKRAVAVTVKVGGRSHLAAAVEHDSSVQGLDLTENSLKEAVIKSVPEYMLPEIISITDHLPVSSNAKIDRKAIIQELSQRHTENRNAPETELECRIAEIWSEILGTPEVSRDDDFFLCGGDSLSATRFVQLMESRHITPSPLPLRVLFGSTTVKALAEYITVQMSSEQCANEESIEEGTL
jgi:yersiniabactin nonribosomal peptide synthetase